uniref:Uncharacterized protein n=1 Tax=Rhizophora mucronata TaxID=61149 RepID=A0A2P2P5N4_RHIMU
MLRVLTIILFSYFLKELV